jgi:hypothetical protein
MTLNKFFIYLSLTTCMMAAHATPNFVNNQPTTPNAALSAPTINPYYGSDGKFAGNSQSVNGGTSYYKNGQYQGQTSAGSNIYYNQAGQMQIINSAPPSLNPK